MTKTPKSGLTTMEILLSVAVVMLLALVAFAYLPSLIAVLSKELSGDSRPDLIVTKIDLVGRDTGSRLGDVIPNNEVFHMVPSIKNIGKSAVSLDKNLQIAVGVDDGVNAIGSCKAKTITLNPDEEIECDSPNKGGFGNSEGAHTVFAIVDYTNIVNESSKKNNNLSINITIGGGDCTDSDGGKNFYVYGKTKGLDGSGSDVCIGSTLTGLAEHYCDGAYHKYVTYQCPNGCRDGACLNSTG